MLSFTICCQCRGSLQTKCTRCGMSKAMYKKQGFANEVEQMNDYWIMWIRARDFKQLSTGSESVDALIVKMWGVPWPGWGGKPAQKLKEVRLDTMWIMQNA